MSENHITVNADGVILGRLCSYVAKKALNGYTVDVVNIEKSVLTGQRRVVLEKFKRFRNMGEPFHGPFIGRSAKDLFKRSLRRMVPHKKARGVEALARVKAYKGMPARFTDTKMETLQESQVSKVPNTKYLQLHEVTSYLGGK